MRNVVVKDTCPRRAENYPVVEEMLDGWEYRGQYLFCAYCGSLQPTMLLSLMTVGCELGPTDKSYKVYVEQERQRIGKFYFQHFSVEDMNRFIELFNMKTKTFTIGYPGHFYVVPYFMRLEVPNDSTTNV